MEAQALSALLLLLARAQEAAVGAADVAAAVKWTDLEATLCMALSALEAQLHALPGRTPLQGQSAAAGAAQAGTGGVGSAADGTEAAGAVLEAGSRSDSGEEEGELHSSLRQPQVQQQQAQPQPQPDADLPPPLPADCEQSEAAAGVGPPFPPPDAVHTQRGALETHAAPLPHSPPASLPPLPDEQPKKRRGPAAPSGVGKKARSGAGGAAPVAAAAALAGGSGAGHSKMGRSAASLINKWQKVAEEVAAQEEEEAAEEERLDDPLARAAASSAQRRRGAEEWRMQQLRSGAADGNSNFQVRLPRALLQSCRPGSSGSPCGLQLCTEPAIPPLPHVPGVVSSPASCVLALPPLQIMTAACAGRLAAPCAAAGRATGCTGSC